MGGLARIAPEPMAGASAITYNIYRTKATEYVRIVRGRKLIQIYTDGACLGNPGPGGWGAVIIEDGRKRTMSGADKSTTNNRMEIVAVIEALRDIPSQTDVTVFSDSRYVINTITKNWKRNRNQDLWELLEEEIRGEGGGPQAHLWCCPGDAPDA